MTMLAERVTAETITTVRGWRGGHLPRCAIILARISDARDGDEQGVNRQEKDGRILADRIGWAVGPGETHVIVENDTSAFHRRKVCRSCLYPERACSCPPLPDGRKRDTVLRTWRPGFRRALEMLRTGQADGLIALDLDRACRDPRDLEDLIDVVESRRPRIPVESVTGSLRLANDADVTMARVMVSVANKSSRDTGRRVARKRQEQAAAGTYGGGGRPYGYGVPKALPVTDQVTGLPVLDDAGRVRMVPVLDDKTGRPVLDMTRIVEAEAAEIRRMADLVLAGVSLRTITADLRERGVPTATGAEWTAGTVKDVLVKPRNAGLAVHGVREAAKAYRDRGEPVPYDAGVIGKAVWPAILPEDTWRAVAAILTDPARRTSPGNTPRWLGSLIYRCGACAAAGTEQTCTISAGAGSRPPTYMCRGPVAHLRRTAARVDEFVTDVIIARLSRPDAAELFARPQAAAPDRAALSSELNTLRERANQLGAAFADGAITSAQLRTGSERVNGRIREIEFALAAAVTRSPLDGLPLGAGEDRVREAWDRLPLGTRRAIVRLLVNVTILPSKAGRPSGTRTGETTVITWRQ